MREISECHYISTNSSESINGSQEKSDNKKNAMSKMSRNIKSCDNNHELCTDDIRSVLKETTAILASSQSTDNFYGDENASKSLDMIVPKSISLACGCVNYESDKKRWQILYRMSPLYFDDNILSSNEKQDLMSKSNQQTSYSASSYVNMRSLIPYCLLLQPSHLLSFNDWKLELNESWFFNIFQILRNRTKTSLPVAYLTSSRNKTESPPFEMIQFILERVELYSLLSTVEILFSTKDDSFSSNKSLSPFLVTLRNGKMIDLSPLIISENANISSSVREKITKDKTTCISIMKYAKEIILASLIISCTCFPNIKKSSTTSTDNELKYYDNEGYVHPFRRIAINFCMSCLYSVDKDSGKNKNSIMKTRNEKSKNSQESIDDKQQEQSIDNNKEKSTIIPDLNKSIAQVEKVKKKRKRRRSTEVINLTKEYTVPQKKKENNFNQLFANDFSVDSILQTNHISNPNTLSRPKRQLKAVIRFEAKPANERMDRKTNQVRIGDGFNCPRCDHWLSYDSIQCDACGLNCKYQAGIGVVVIKDRNEVTKNQDFQCKPNKMESTPHTPIVKKKEYPTETKKETLKTETKKETEVRTSLRSTLLQQNSLQNIVDKELLWNPIQLNDVFHHNTFNQQFFKKKMNLKNFEDIESSNDIDKIKKFVTKALKIIDTRLNTLKVRSSTKKAISQQESVENDEYVSEIRLYKRTLRDRGAKQEHERGEQEKYKQKAESEQLVHQYVNRNKKRSKEDQELLLLEGRPVRYVSKNAWKNAGCRKCDIKNCCLCGYVFAHLVLVTHGLPHPQCREKETQSWTCESLDVQSPDFHEISEEELLWSDDKLDTSQKYDTYSDEKLIGKRLSIKGKNKNFEEEMRLKTIKNDLIFLRRYNEGIMKNAKVDR